MAIPFLGYYLTQDQGASVATTGVILTTCGVGGVVSQWAGGLLVDRFGYRTTLVGGMAAAGVALFALGLSQNLYLIGLCAFLAGASSELWRPASAAMVAHLFRQDQLPRTYGMLYWAVNLGYGFSMMLGGVLTRHGFTLIFIINIATCLASAALVWKALPADDMEGRTAETASGSYVDVLRDRLMVAYLAATFCYAIVFRQAGTTLPLAMNLDGLSSSAFGFIMTVNAVIIITVQPLILPSIGKLKESTALITGIVLIGLGFGATALVSSPAGYTATVALWSLGEIAVFCVNQAMVAHLAPEHLRGRYYGLYGMAWAGAMLAAPLMGTRLLEHSAVLLWTVCAVLCLLAVAVQGAIASRMARRQG
ncbi:MDR family MFS transporter [Streptomyces aureocirculatus]|uniref:MDR family MFS transporter n=1 Tax=Streptomyces aureocirculatus TaxID=67275 RepID=UPI001CEC1D69|nr:MFS transporter [Streptomyces aureocirculatus]